MAEQLTMGEPEIIAGHERTCVGMFTRMSLTRDETRELWQSFMPRRDEILNRHGTALFSIEVYPEGFFSAFNPDSAFDKWAAVEVSEAGPLPGGMAAITVPAGLYAVFIYRGPASMGAEAYKYIFGTWLPGSDYIIDYRPHMAIMGRRYRGEHPDSEEALWIPVRKAE